MTAQTSFEKLSTNRAIVAIPQVTKLPFQGNENENLANFKLPT